MALAGAVALGGAGCSTHQAARVQSAVPGGPDTAVPVDGGCGMTPLYRSPTPSWAASAGIRGVNRLARSEHGDALAVLFSPLNAGRPTNPANKILWVVRLPRDGSALTIRAHPVDSSSPEVTLREPANAGPGEIYPSIVDMPGAGCWHLELLWNHHSDAIDLRYAPVGA